MWREFEIRSIASYSIDDGEAALADMKSVLDALHRSLAVIEFDLEGNILAANRNYCAMMGYAEDEIVGRHHSIFCAPAHVASEEYWNFWRALASGEFEGGEFKRIAKDGSEVWIQATYNPILGPDGAPVRVMKFATDVTARMIEAAETEGQVRAIQRSEAVIEFSLTGHILKANPNYCEMMGYSEDEIVGKHHSIFCDAEFAASPSYTDFWRRLSAGEFESGEFKRVAKDGSEVWIQATYNPILDPDGAPTKVLKLASDISEMKRREEELAAAHAVSSRFAALSEATTDWFWEIDPDGRVSYLSENFSRYVSNTRDTEVGKTRADLVVRYEDDDLARKIEGLIAERKPFRDLIYLRRTHDGREIWVRVSGAPRYASDGTFLGYHGAGSEITAAMIVRERRNQLAELLDKAPIGLLLFDRNMKISILNNYMQESFSAYTEGVTVGSDYRDLVRASIRAGYNPIDLSEADEYIERRIAALKSGPTQIEQTRGERSVEIRTMPLGDGSIILFEIDSTDRRELRDQLVHSQRLEAVGHLTAGVAHDFNNLLAIIVGSLELLSEDLKDRPEADLVDTALSATNRGATLTGQLLAFGRRASLSPEVVDVDASIRGVEQLLRRTLPENISLDLKFADTGKLIEVDPRQLEQALLNLVINARDAIEDKGRIAISTARTASKPVAAGGDPGAGEEGDFIAITVGDDGKGIPADVVDKVFEPFFTTKGVGQGSGLGLSMVHGFVSQSGGDITIDSELGEGTRVSLLFPAARRQPERRRTGGEVKPVRLDRRLRVLVVEDNSGVRRITRAHLESFGYEVTEASDGKAALRELAANPDIDVMLTDVVMPGKLQGGQLIVEARRMRPTLRAVMFTGYAETAASEVLFDDVETLIKPVSRANLRAAIEAAAATDRDAEA